jgi:carbon monoxide dehydrogenase subunit G
MPAAAATAWALLQDVEAVAACMPGARITERVDASRYKGLVQVKLGPASLGFRGEIEVREVDSPTRTLRLFGKGLDGSGSSAATMDLTARIDPAGDGASTLVGTAEISMSGKAATFGARLIEPVAEHVLRQFADNFAARLAAAAPPPSEGPGASPAVSEPAPFQGLARAWAALREWLQGLFGPRRA